MPLLTRAVGAISVSLVSLPVGTAAAAAAPAQAPALGAYRVPPPPTKRLPDALDVAPRYQKGTRCMPNPRPGVLAFADLLNEHYGRRWFGINRFCAAMGEHPEGRALDWAVNASKPDDLALANSIVRWLSEPDERGRPGAMARRFGINYIIWNRKVWRTFAPERGWTAYTGVSPHTDHIHFSFTWDGAYKRTSWWTGKAVTEPLTGPLPQDPTDPGGTSVPSELTASGYPLLRRGSRGAEVAIAQRVVGAQADGVFGAQTASAVARWQGAKGLPRTSVMDNATWTKMVALRLVPARTGLGQYVNLTLQKGSRGPAVVALQKALGGLVADGRFGALTETRVRAYQRAKGLTVNGIVTTPVWKALLGEKPDTGIQTSTTATEYTPHLGTVLRVGSSGPAVRVLQAGLGGLAVDGRFGSRTSAAVRVFQSAQGLRATGVVDRTTWLRLEARAHPLLRWWGTVLRTGSSGPAVAALQRALGVAADGRFGPRTAAAVKDAQARSGLARTGVVGTVTWKAVERLLTAR